MTICVHRNVCICITLDYMKNTNILIHECVNISVFHIVSSGINIHVLIHMNMVIGLPRSTHVNINTSTSISINISISISIMHIRISLNVSVSFNTKTGI